MDEVKWAGGFSGKERQAIEDAVKAVGIDESSVHLAHHAHLFAAGQEVLRTQKVAAKPYVAPADPVNEHRWREARIDQIRPGDKVRVMRDAYDSDEIGRIHNGRVCEVLEVRDGDVICRSIDNREPGLDGAHYPPYRLEQWSEVSGPAW